jgi:hypothetical protein
MPYLCAVVRLEQVAKAALLCSLALFAACERPPQTGAMLVTVRPPASTRLVSATLHRSGESEFTTLSLISQDGQWVANVKGLAVSASYVVVAGATAEDGSTLSTVQFDDVILAPGKTAQVLMALRPSPNGLLATVSPPCVDTFWVSADKVDAGETIDLRASAHSADSTTRLTYAWTASCGKFGQTQGQATTWTAPDGTDTCQLTVTVSDAQGRDASASAKVQVGAVHGSASIVVVIDNPPQVTGIQASPGPMVTGTAVTLSVSARDPDADALAYRWRCSCAGRFSDPTQAATSFMPVLANGADSCTFLVEVNDGRGGLGTGTLAISAKQPVIHLGPTMGVTVQSTDVANPGDVVMLFAQASTPDGGALTWTWSASAGSLLDQVDQPSTSDIRWTAPATTVGSCTITATATDAWGVGASYVFNIET